MGRTELYDQISRERFEILNSRHIEFIKNMHNMRDDPIRIFDPLGKKHMEDLIMIRELSATLQAKKDEDIKKAEQANAEELENKKDPETTESEQTKSPEETKEESV